MNKSLQQVADFHRLFNHPIGENPQSSEPLKTRQLRIKLLFEELAELAEASDCKATMAKLSNDYINKLLEANGGMEASVEEANTEFQEMILDAREIKDGDNVNKTEELDALCDIQYVLNGKILTAGLHRVFDPAFNQVQANNMAKAHASEDHCLETITQQQGGHLTPDWRNYFNIEKKGEFYILSNAHGKVIKPHNHEKVKLNMADLSDFEG
jgi:predicted HAD superfamily Cof-like phosphohydrolase